MLILAERRSFVATQVAEGLWTLLEVEESEPTHHAAERAPRQSVMPSKTQGLPRKKAVSLRSRQGASCCRPITACHVQVAALLSADVSLFLEQAWIADRGGGWILSCCRNDERAGIRCGACARLVKGQEGWNDQRRASKLLDPAIGADLVDQT